MVSGGIADPNSPSGEHSDHGNDAQAHDYRVDRNFPTFISQEVLSVFHGQLLNQILWVRRKFTGFGTGHGDK